MLITLLFLHIFAADKVTICYLSLNNEKEFTVTQSFMDGLNKKTGSDIKVIEFQSPEKEANPEKSFERMIESGAPCDGLVISGHHYGKFGGKQANGQLGIDFMEKLSCNPKYKEWFSNIKSLWLQGCRTLGVGTEEHIASDQDVDADYHTMRVGNVIGEDNLQTNFADLNMEFSGTLDLDNPLSSRYLRVFPRATVFGWTKSAPGENAKSEYSIPYHMAHIAALNEGKTAKYIDPSLMSTDVAAKYANAVLGLFKPDKGDKCEFNNIDAWINHGHVKNNGVIPGFDNPDLQAFPALAAQDNPKLKQAKDLACLLDRAESEEDILKYVDSILADKELIAFNFNNLWELIHRLKKEGSSVEEKVRKKLRENVELNAFISKKLYTKNLGILRKIDYYSFLRDLKLEPIPAVEDKILEASQKIFSIKADDYNGVDFQITLIQSLAKNKLLASKRGRDLILRASENSNPDLRSGIALQARNLGDYGLEILNKFKKDTSAKVRSSVSAASVQLYPASKDLVEEIMKDKNDFVRWSMVEALPTMTNKTDAKYLLQILRGDTAAMVREVAVDIAAKLQDTDTLVLLMDDSNPLVSQRAKSKLQPSSLKNIFD